VGIGAADADGCFSQGEGLVGLGMNGVFGLDPVDLVGHETFGEHGVGVDFEGREDDGHSGEWGDGVVEWWSDGLQGLQGYMVTGLHGYMVTWGAVMRDPPTPRAANGKWQMADGRFGWVFMLEFLDLGAEGVIGIGGPWRRPRVRRAGDGRVLRL